MGTANNLHSFSFAPGAVFDPARFECADLGVLVSPSFSIRRSDRVLVLGSCFAARVGDALRGLGFDASDAGLDLKYNTFSMLQEVRWCLEGGFGAAHILRTSDGMWCNPHRHPARPHSSRARVLNRHLKVQAAANPILRSADVLVLTLGLTEVWHDLHLDIMTNETPPAAEALKPDGRFAVRRTSHAQNRDALLSLVEELRAVNPGLRILASVSPVPLKATFFGDDVLISNCISKSTLRAALEEALIQLRGDGVPIDYFPSYEIATLAPDRREVWRETFPDGSPDGRHVKEDFVAKAILPTFVRAYVRDERFAA